MTVDVCLVMSTHMCADLCADMCVDASVELYGHVLTCWYKLVHMHVCEHV